MQSITGGFHETRGLFYHGGALLYVLAGYALGVAGLLQDALWINVLATMLWAHALVIAAYLIHECAHNTIFRRNRHNARLGRLLSWITGSAYGTFEDIRFKHFRHHVDNDDRVWFDVAAFLRRRPGLTRLIQALEWCYVPAQEVLMHGLMAVSAFFIPQRRRQRRRQVVVIVLRGGVFLAALWWAPRVAVGYVLAYLGMLHVLRFMDAFQHDYDAHRCLYDDHPASRFGGRETEQEHTFSNPVSRRWEWPNWLVLNFGFHNAHHQRPTLPWYRLRDAHRAEFGDDPEGVIPLSMQLRMYHRHRVWRVTHRGGPLDRRQEVRGAEYLAAARRGELYGGNAVSFLTSF